MDAITELRQRRKDENEGKEAPTRSFSKRLEKLDIYPKISDDYVIKTESGGYVSLISSIIVIVLFIVEYYNYVHIQRYDRITIDNTRNEKLKINFNISLYELTCDKASLDVMDVSGQQQMGISSRLVKIDMDDARSPVNVAFASVLEEKVTNSTCGNCYGAGIEGVCCNTCDELLDMYVLQGWDIWFVSKYAPQCRTDNKDVLKEKLPSRGCMIWGSLLVNKVAGNFHVAVGHAENRDSRHVHSFGVGQIMSYNASHHIEKLSFGDYIPGIVNPLNNYTAEASSPMSYNYYMKVVPTVYKTRKVHQLSNQYSVNKVDRRIEMSPFGQVAGLPGVFFIYDISPFMHIISEKSITFTHFLVRVCAVIGGVAAIARLIDTIMYYRVKV